MEQKQGFLYGCINHKKLPSIGPGPNNTNKDWGRNSVLKLLYIPLSSNPGIYIFLPKESYSSYIHPITKVTVNNSKMWYPHLGQETSRYSFKWSIKKNNNTYSFCLKPYPNFDILMLTADDSES